MRCLFCNKPVFGNDGLSLPGRGVSHKNCFQVHEAIKRTFKGLNITTLNDAELLDLKNLVLSEENSRNGENDVELF